MFISPDSYVQAPDFTQSFNRYSYCLNNPLVYTDPDGEFFWIIPNIGWSKSGGLSIGISMVFGVPGLLTYQVGGGYNFKSNEAYGYAGATFAFNTASLSYSSSGGWSTGYTAGASVYSGLPVSTNFLTIGATYNISHGGWGGNVSAWFVDQSGWTFNPSVSAMVLPEQTTNFIRKGRFINNDKMLSKFVAASDYQGALDYFGFEGTYRPKKGAGADYVKGTDYYGSTDPTTGNIYYGNFAFSSFDNLYSTYVKESYTQKNAINGTVAINEEYANDPNLRNLRYYPEEAKGFKYAFERTGLFYRTKINNFNQANAYWIGSYGEPLMTKRWWHFIYKIPRKW